jgi:hypothetical protein
LNECLFRGRPRINCPPLKTMVEEAMSLTTFRAM